jgi:hypothetical protein
MHLEEEKCIQHLGWKPEGKGYLENLGTEGIILKCILKIWDRNKNTINLAQDMNKQSLVNMTMQFQVSSVAGYFLTGELLASPERVCYME